MKVSVRRSCSQKGCQQSCGCCELLHARRRAGALGLSLCAPVGHGRLPIDSCRRAFLVVGTPRRARGPIRTGTSRRRYSRSSGSMASTSCSSGCTCRSSARTALRRTPGATMRMCHAYTLSRCRGASAAPLQRAHRALFVYCPAPTPSTVTPCPYQFAGDASTSRRQHTLRLCKAAPIHKPRMRSVLASVDSLVAGCAPSSFRVHVEVALLFSRAGRSVLRLVVGRQPGQCPTRVARPVQRLVAPEMWAWLLL